MKKIVYAIVIAAIVATAGAVQAATVYQKDGLSYEIKGDWQIQLRQDPGEDQNLELEYDDLEIKNRVAYDLGNGLSAFGQLDFGLKDAADAKTDSPEIEEAYLGFKYKMVALAFGKTDSAADEFGIEGFIEAVRSEDAFDAAGATDGDDLIKVAAEIGMVNIVVAHELEAEGEDSENGTFTDVFVGAEFFGVSMGAAYQTLTPTPGADSIDTYGVQAGYDAGFAALAADYSIANVEDDNLTIWNIFVSAPVSTVTLGAGYQMETDDAAGTEDVATYCINAVYKFPAQKNVSLFAEIANSDEDDSDMGYLLGARIKF